jgi:hypothetical protein
MSLTIGLIVRVNLKLTVLVDHGYQLPRLIRWNLPLVILEIETDRFSGPLERAMAAFPALAIEAEPARHFAGITEPNILRVVADRGQELSAAAHELTLRR